MVTQPTEPRVPIKLMDTDAPGITYREFDLIAAGAPYQASTFSIAPGHRTPRDEHAVRECWFIACGVGTLVYEDNQRIEIKAGELLFFESHRRHWVENTGTEELKIFSTWWRKETGCATT